MEASTMESGYESSAVSESTDATQSTTGADRQSDASNTNYIILGLCALLLLGIILVVLFTTVSSDSSSDPQAQGQGGSDEDSNKQQGSYIAPAKANPSDSAATTRGTALHTTPTEEKSAKGSAAKSATTTQRPIPPHTLLCTYGIRILADTPFPEDGVCDYIMLEELPVSKADDLVNFPANIQPFVQMASKHQKTEYAFGFKTESTGEMEKILKEEPTKAHFHSLFEKRIFHFGYFTTTTFTFFTKMLNSILNVLKEISNLMDDKKTPSRPIYTFVASYYNPNYDDISAKNLANAFKTIHMPDLFISKVHLVDPDFTYNVCMALPATILKRPQVWDKNLYFCDLFTGVKHLEDVHKLRPTLGASPALSVSVGLSGRWYRIRGETKDDSVVGKGCRDNYPGAPSYEQEQNPSSVCKQPGLSKMFENKDHHCKYFINRKNNTAFLFDSVETLRYKLCASKKNARHFKYGFSAVHLEFDDASGKCGQGKFPLTRTVKKILEFFQSKYTAVTGFHNCIAEVRPSLYQKAKKH